MNYDQLLFSELRLVAAQPCSDTLDDSSLVKAVTLNEELLALGYTLSPTDVVKLSKCRMDGFVEGIRNSIGDVKAEPMYPDFPSQVMEMDAAVFRFHQLVHYLSTYGIEDFTGAEVRRGWLPEMQKTEKTQPDETLLSAKVIALIDPGEKYTVPYSRILSKTERMDDKERMMILECIKHLSPEELAAVRVRFKQNLLDIFNSVFSSEELESGEKLACLHALCQHTGDVWKCMDYALTRAGFHFRTSQKRLIVKLVESYSLDDLKTNLILSNRKGERTLLMLKYLDFNEYSRKEGFAEAVAAFRSGSMRSWESGVKFLVEHGAPEALDMYAERPGMMLRHLTYLMRNGYRAEDIYEKLAPKAAALKTQTIVTLISHFSRPELAKLGEERFREGLVLSRLVTELLGRRLAANETKLRDKKVFIDMPDFDLARSAIRVTDKSSEGGYIRSGLAYRIPEGVNSIRFFVYWNDTKRVDVDLHAAIYNLDGERENVGWNADFRSGTAVFSGDITHSDAAEYIDIDLVRGKDVISTVTANINLFGGYQTFREIDECFVGAMAVEKTGLDIKLYDPKNCFFTHYLTGSYKRINYGWIDVPNRVIVFDGTETTGSYYSEKERRDHFSLEKYLEILFRAQNVSAAASAEEADLVLVMGKPVTEKQISLIDNNFFME